MTLNVLASFADQGGCGDYRVRFPVAVVNAQENLDIYAEAVDHFDCDATFADNKYHIRQVFIPSGVHVVSVQRPCHAATAGVLAWLRSRRPDVGLVVELDDDLLSVPTANVAHERLQRRNNIMENVEWLRQSLTCADVVTVSTPELARIYSSSSYRTHVVRNGVPSSMLDLPSRNIDRFGRLDAEEKDDRIIGWAGYIGTHPGDLEVTCGALTDFVGLPRRDARTMYFRNIGPREGVAKALSLSEENVEASGWLDPELYRVALGELDIGIVPLQDTRFNRCKSALKVLEMAAVGVPAIASRLPEFERLQQTGMPIWLAQDRRRHWVGALSRATMLVDKDLRDIGATCREYVRRNATVELRAKDWADAWRTAAQVARARMSRRSA